MERLTTRDNGHPALARGYEERFAEPSLFFMLLNRLAAYEDTMPLERAQELAQADKDGRLVVLPCKVGDLVYQITVRKKYLNRSMCTPYIKSVEIKTENAFKYMNDIGKTVFLTREEAEAALKKREEAENETD